MSLKRGIFVLGLSLLGVSLGYVVLAQEASVGISPLTFEITANPGEVLENYLRVVNPSSENTISIGMTAEDIAPTGEVGHVVVEPAETETYSLARWVKIEPEEFTLAPREEKTIKLTLTIPENAEPGGHYGTIVAGGKAIAAVGVPGVPVAPGAAIVPRVGSLVLLTISGVMEEKLAVKDFTAPRYSEYGPIKFAIRFENTGTVHVRPRGLITITDWLGKKVADIPFPEKNVLPKAIRKFEASWDEKWLWIGKYTATLTGSYGLSNIPLTPTVITFWVFPWKVGLGILAVIILLILSRRRWLAAFRVLIKGEK